MTNKKNPELSDVLEATINHINDPEYDSKPLIGVRSIDQFAIAAFELLLNHPENVDESLTSTLLQGINEDAYKALDAYRNLRRDVAETMFPEETRKEWENYVDDMKDQLKKEACDVDQVVFRNPRHEDWTR